MISIGEILFEDFFELQKKKEEIEARFSNYCLIHNKKLESSISVISSFPFLLVLKFDIYEN
jgi:hypothetical protein